MYALEQLKIVLHVLDCKLRMRCFLVGDGISFADLLFCCHLDRLFRLMICSRMREEVGNLMRWYGYVRNLNVFIGCIGEMVLCEN